MPAPKLRASADAGLDELLRTKHQAADGRAQLDIFMDTEESAVANDLASALLAHDVDAAEDRLWRLADISPQHWAVPDATTLVDAVKATSAQQADAEQRRILLERRWLPAASALLHAQAVGRRLRTKRRTPQRLPERPRRNAATTF